MARFFERGDGQHVVGAILFHPGVPHLLGQGNRLRLFTNGHIHRGQIIEGIDGPGVIGPELFDECISNLFQQAARFSRPPNHPVRHGQIAAG